MRFAWRDRSGKLLGTVGSPGERYFIPSISPDGSRVAASRALTERGDGVWMLEGSRESRITFDDPGAAFPVWSADGQRIIYVSVNASRGVFDFYVTSIDGTETPRKVLGSAQPKYPSGWSADGRYLVYFVASPQTLGDLWVLPLTGGGEPSLLLASPYFEVWPRLSPDGRWLAYHSDESGRGEVYVRPFLVPPEGGTPTLGTGRWQVSTGGGIFPMWSHDGRELFYLSPSGAMMTAGIGIEGNVLKPGIPEKLFDTQVFGGGADNASGRQYDVTRDGRFLINELMDVAIPPITLLQNWRPPEK